MNLVDSPGVTERFRTDRLTWAASHRGYIHPWVPEIPAGLTDVKAFSHEGSDYIFVPCTIENSVRMGVSPVPPDYPWPMSGGKTPYSHQRATTEFGLANKECIVLNSQGTGKTIAISWAADLLMQKTKLPILIISPLSTLEATWQQSWFTNFPKYKSVVLHGSKAKRVKLLESPSDVYIINPAGCKVIEQELRAVRKFCMIIVDESTCLRNHKSATWKALNAVADAHREYANLVCMTGTPVANNPLAAYGQMRWLRPVWTKNKYPFFTHYKQSVVNTVNQFIDIPKANALEVVNQLMQPSIRFALKDCRELPPRVFETRVAPMTPEQHKAYEAMRKSLIAEHQTQQITAVNEGVKLGKLWCIAAGTAYDEEGKPAHLPYGPRFDALCECIEEAERKVLVVVNITALLDRIHADLVKKGYKCAVIDGRTPSHARRDIINNFENKKDPHIILLNIAAVAHGVTMNAASTMIFMTPTYDNELYEQFLARNQRLNSEESTVVIHVVSSPTEEVMFEKLDKKGKIQGAFLDIVAMDSKKYVQR